MAATNVAVMPTKNTTLLKKFADRFSVDQAEVMNILKATAFKQREGQPPATDEQLFALMIVADQYGLNPFTKEIYAYPDKSNGIVPVVGVDGWSRIVNEHPMMDGIEFRYSDETVQHKGKTCHVWIEAVITRKDRNKPIVVREYFDEVVRSVNFATPWDTHPKRMHRHKTFIQGGRVAFGFGGIYDEDEAQRIMEKDITADVVNETHASKPEVPVLDEQTFKAYATKHRPKIEDGSKQPGDFIAWIESKGMAMTDEQKSEVESWAKPKTTTIEGEATEVDDDFVAEMEQAEGNQ